MSNPPNEKDKIILSYSEPEDPPLKRKAIRAIERLSGHKKLQKIYDEVTAMNLEGHELFSVIMKRLKVEPVWDNNQLTKIPKEGPLVIVANHPFGVVDGMILAYILSHHRSEFKVIVNSVLVKDDVLANYLLPIDFKETKEAMTTNIETRRASLKQLKKGNAVAIFPSGAVSTAPKPFAPAEDLEWKRFVAKLIQQTKATVVPIYVHGQNSRMFQIVSQFSVTLRLGMLMHEVKNKMGKEIPVKIGDPIPFDRIAHIKNKQELLDHLREKTFELKM